MQIFNSFNHLVFKTLKQYENPATQMFPMQDCVMVVGSCSILQSCDQVSHVGWLIAHTGQAYNSSCSVTALQVLHGTDRALSEHCLHKALSPRWPVVTTKTDIQTSPWLDPYEMSFLPISERNRVILNCIEIIRPTKEKCDALRLKIA